MQRKKKRSSRQRRIEQSKRRILFPLSKHHAVSQTLHLLYDNAIAKPYTPNLHPMPLSNK